MNTAFQKLKQLYSAEAQTTKFNSPATDSMLKAFDQSLGIKMPQIFYDLYQWQNGSLYREYSYRSTWYDNYEWLNLEDILRIKKDWDSLTEDGTFDKWEEGTYWNQLWVPILHLADWYLVVIDMAGSFGGEVGQMIGFDYKAPEGRAVLYPDLETWLEEIAALKAEGMLAENDDEDEDDSDVYFTDSQRNRINELKSEINPGNGIVAELWQYVRKSHPQNPEYETYRKLLAPDTRDETAAIRMFENSLIGVEEKDLYHELQATPLLYAARAGTLEVAAWLLDQGADPRQSDPYGYDAENLIRKALIEDDLWEKYDAQTLTGKLEAAGVDLDWTTWLWKSALKGIYQVVDLCLEKGADPNDRPRFQEHTTLMHELLKDRPDPDVFLSLFENGADLLAKDGNGQTPRDHFQLILKVWVPEEGAFQILNENEIGFLQTVDKILAQLELESEEEE